MPSLSAHFACATIVQEKLSIENKFDFFRGTIYPDLVQDSHFKMKSNNGVFMVPCFSEYLQTIKYNLGDFEKGYLVHLLLDKYYLEEFACKYGLEPFLNKKIYCDYSLISTKLLADFNVDKKDVLETIMSFEHEIDKNKLIEMSEFLRQEEHHQYTNIINYYELKKFIEQISNTITNETEQIMKNTKKLEKKIN